MVSPNSSGNTQQLRNSGSKGKSPFGCLVLLLLLLGAGAGLYFLWKNKQGAANSFITSLNLPGMGNNVIAPNPNSPAEGFSQSAPINYSQGGGKQNKRSAGINEAVKKKNISSKFNKSSNVNLVPSGYPLVAPSLPASKKIDNKTFLLQSFLPKLGLIPGSYESLIAYPEEKPHPLAVKPSQIIVFKTNYYNRMQALDYVTQKLKANHFGGIQMQIDDYERGGSTVLEARDVEGNQVFVSFKPLPERYGTAWKIDFYKVR